MNRKEKEEEDAPPPRSVALLKWSLSPQMITQSSPQKKPRLN